MLNPYAKAIGRWFEMAVSSLGAVACVALVVSSLSSGVAPGFGRRQLSEATYTMAASPSQFWFGIVFYAALAGLFGWGAWRAYRS